MLNKLFNNSPTTLIALSGLVSLVAVTALVVFVYLSVQQIVVEQTASAELINTSGRQRMLSQRAAFYTLEYVDHGSMKDREFALEAMEVLEKNHASLVSALAASAGDSSSDPITSQLSNLLTGSSDSIDRRLRDYLALLNSTIEQDTSINTESAATLKTQSQELLVLFDSAVTLYEKQSKARIAGLTEFQMWVFLVILGFVLVQALFVIRPMLRISHRLTEKLREEANRDSLTGLYNRRMFRDLAEQISLICRRNRQPFSLVLLDIDDFKSINDGFGHLIGDDVIQFVSQTVLSVSRESDEVFRFGGDEFVVLLPQTDQGGAELLATKIQTAIQHMSNTSSVCPCRVTLSVGVASNGGSHESIDAMLKRADTKMYQSKRQRKILDKPAPEATSREVPQSTEHLDLL